MKKGEGQAGIYGLGGREGVERIADVKEWTRWEDVGFSYNQAKQHWEVKGMCIFVLMCFQKF